MQYAVLKDGDINEPRGENVQNFIKFRLYVSLDDKAAPSTAWMKDKWIDRDDGRITPVGD